MNTESAAMEPMSRRGTRPAHILLIEDHEDIAFGLKSNLEVEGHRVEVASDGEPGLEALRQRTPDLVILDLMLPGKDGYQVLAEMRRAGYNQPVLILSARGEEMDKVHGFRLGADDYVTKPFGMMELLARIDAILQRAGDGGNGAGHSGRWQFGRVEVDKARRMVTRDGRPVSLTPLEFDLLVVLLEKDGAVAERLELLEKVWGHSGEVVTRTVDTHIAELRNKLEDHPSTPRYIKTVPKVGYRLQVDRGG